MIRRSRVAKLTLPFCAMFLALGLKSATAGDSHFQYAYAFVAGVGDPVASGGTLNTPKY